MTGYCSRKFYSESHNDDRCETKLPSNEMQQNDNKFGLLFKWESARKTLEDKNIIEENHR